MHYLLHAFDIMKVFYNMGNGVRQGLNFSEFSRLQIFEPSIEEQNEIVDYLNRKVFETNSIISAKTKQLEMLTKYKKSLIYEYVTGKKEVWMIPIKEKIQELLSKGDEIRAVEQRVGIYGSMGVEGKMTDKWLNDVLILSSKLPIEHPLIKHIKKNI